MEGGAFSPIVSLLTFAYCDRCIPPDREDVQMLALEMLREFVTDTVPVGKRRAVFEELRVSLAAKRKWTMVRLICQKILLSSWSPYLLPMTQYSDCDYSEDGEERCRKRSRELGVAWVASHKEEVLTSGTETMKWMLDIVESAFMA